MSDDVLVVTRQGQLAELWSVTSWRVVAYLALSVVLGALGGIMWSWVAPLPTYLVGDDMVATITERGNTAIIGSDVTFAAITAVIGLVLGALGWMFLHRQGWLVVVMPLVASFAASLVAWRVGLLVGESGFVERLAGAQAGDVVQIDLALRSVSALIVGPFFAITPVMLMAAFWPEAAVDRPDDQKVTSD